MIFSVFVDNTGNPVKRADDYNMFMFEQNFSDLSDELQQVLFSIKL